MKFGQDESPFPCLFGFLHHSSAADLQLLADLFWPSWVSWAKVIIMIVYPYFVIGQKHHFFPETTRIMDAKHDTKVKGYKKLYNAMFTHENMSTPPTKCSNMRPIQSSIGIAHGLVEKQKPAELNTKLACCFLISEASVPKILELQFPDISAKGLLRMGVVSLLNGLAGDEI